MGVWLIRKRFDFRNSWIGGLNTSEVACLRNPMNVIARSCAKTLFPCSATLFFQNSERWQSRRHMQGPELVAAEMARGAYRHARSIICTGY